MIKPFQRLYEGAQGGDAGGVAAGSGAATGAATGQGGAAGGQAALGTSWWSGWAKPDGSLDHAALDKAPDEIKGAAAILKRYPTFEDLPKALIHQHKLISSGKGLEPLREGASDIEKQTFRQTFRKINQVPDTPDAYGVGKTLLESIPADMHDPEFATQMAKVMHEADFSPAQAQAVVSAYGAHMKGLLEASEAESAKAAQAELQRANDLLNKEWGVNRPRMEELARRGALTGGLDPNSDLFKLPEVQIMAARFARMVGEDKLVAPADGKGGGPSIQERWRAINSDPSSKFYQALWDTNHPNHLAAQQEFDMLAKLIGAEQDAQRGGR